MYGVVNRLFFVGFDRKAELYRLRVRFRERIRFFRDVPVASCPLLARTDRNVVSTSGNVLSAGPAGNHFVPVANTV